MNKRYMIENYSNLQGQTRSSSTSIICRLFSRIICLSRGARRFPVHYNRFKLNQEGPVAEIKTKDAMGLFYTFKADGEEKLLYLCSGPFRSLCLAMAVRGFSLGGSAAVPDVDGCAGVEERESRGWGEDSLLPYPTGRAAQVGFLSSF